MTAGKNAEVADHVKGQVQDVDGPTPGGFHLEHRRNQANNQIQPNEESQCVLEDRRHWRFLVSARACGCGHGLEALSRKELFLPRSKISPPTKDKYAPYYATSLTPSVKTHFVDSTPVLTHWKLETCPVTQDYLATGKI